MAASPLYAQIASTATATPLSATTVAPATWLLKCPAANTSTVYIGDAYVTAATGYPMEPGDELTFDRRPQIGTPIDITPRDLYVVGTGGIAAWLGFR